MPLIFTIGVAVILWGCATGGFLSTHAKIDECAAVDPVSLSLWASADRDASGQIMNYRQFKRAIAEQVPGFAALFSRHDTLWVLLTNGDDYEGALEARRVAAHLNSDFERFEAHPLEIVEVEYDALQLLRWFRIARDIITIPGVYMAGIDYSNNRLQYGVRDDAVAECVQSNLLNMRIPENAFATYLTEGARQLPILERTF